MLPGGGSFYAGAAHPFVAFEHLLALLALGLLVGKLGERQIGLAALALLSGLLAGALSQTQFAISGSTALLGLALIFGVTLAAVPPIPAGVFIAVSALAGGLVGADTDVLATGDAPLTTRALAATGLMIGAQIIMLNAAALSRIMVQRGWGIVPRVAGSWIGAIAVLLLTLAVTGVTGAPSGAMP